MRRRKGDGQILELIMIHGHDDEIQILQLVPLHLVEVRIGEQLRQLDLPLTPAAAEHHRVVIPDAADGNAALSQHHGLQMIVVLPCGIGARWSGRPLPASMVTVMVRHFTVHHSGYGVALGRGAELWAAPQ